MQTIDSLKPASGLRLNRRLLDQLSSTPGTVLPLVATSVLLGLVIVAQAWVLSLTVAAVSFHSPTDLPFRTAIALLLILALLRGAILVARGASAARLSGRMRASLRHRTLGRLYSLGPSRASQRSSGEWSAALVEGIESLDPYFRHYLPAVATAAVVPLTIVAAVLPNDPVSGLVLILTAPLIPLFMILIGKTANRRLLARWHQLSAMSGHFLEAIQGLPSLRLLGRSHTEAERIRAISERFRLSTLSVLRIAFLAALVLEWAATLSIAVIAVEIGLRLLAGGLGFQTAFFILLLAPEFYLPLRALGAHFHDAAGGITAAEDLLDLLGDERSPEAGAGAAAHPSPSHAVGHVVVRDIGYRYPDQTDWALNGVSFELSPGERMVVVGPSGAGKTTLAWLLLGLLSPCRGSVSVGGHPPIAAASTSGGPAIGWVPQRPFLFAGTVAENIRFGRPGASQRDLERAASQAEAGAFIRQLPQRYDTPIGERGAQLSAGQAQRLAFARAFLADSPILVLDEPTASLDWRAEAAIQTTLDRLMRQRTTILITHRLRGLTDSDSILLLAAGKPLALGRRDDLMRHDGPFRRMVNAAHQGLHA